MVFIFYLRHTVMPWLTSYGYLENIQIQELLKNELKMFPEFLFIIEEIFIP